MIESYPTYIRRPDQNNKCKEKGTNNSNNGGTKELPYNINANTAMAKLPNEIKALSGRKFKGDEFKTFGDAIKPKAKRMLCSSGFNTNSIKLDKIKATCQDSMDLQVNIQCCQEVCRDSRQSSILQQFLKDTKSMDRASKSVWGARKINVESDYKPGGTGIVAFRKTTRKIIQQEFDELGRCSWMSFEGKDNKVILIMSIYPTNPQGKTAYHQQKSMFSQRNRNNCDPSRNFYKDMCKFIRSFKKKNEKQVLQQFKKKTDKKVPPMLIEDWNKECIGKSNSKKLCNKFG